MLKSEVLLKIFRNKAFYLIQAGRFTMAINGGEDETDTMELCSTIIAIVGESVYLVPLVSSMLTHGRVGGILAPLVASLGGFLPLIIFGSLGVLQVNLVKISNNLL